METLLSAKGDFTLTKLDIHPVNTDLDDVIVILIAHNESSRLPFLLDYHRKLGATRFFIVDDKSTDGSRDYLLKQPDCHVFDPSNTYKEAGSGRNWRSILLDKYGVGKWCLILDADELLVYPHCEIVSLPEFCKHLDNVNATSFFAFMLDMYASDQSKAVCEPGKPFYEICPYFDKDYKFRQLGLMNKEAKFLPRIRVAGGPRVRLFYPFQKHTNILCRRLLDMGIKFADLVPFWKINKPHYAPALIKVPLIKWQVGYRRLTSHTMVKPEHGEMAAVTGVLLHYKFFTDFHQKAKNHIEKAQYYKGSQEYQRYLAYTMKHPDFNFMYEGSVRYENSDSVLKAGLIESTADFDSFAESLKKSQKTAA